MRLARLLLLCAVVIWGWTFVATKICLAYMTPIELLGLRLLIAVPVLVVLAVLRGSVRPSRLPLKPVLIGSTLIGIHFFIVNRGGIRIKGVGLEPGRPRDHQNGGQGPQRNGPPPSPELQ